VLVSLLQGLGKSESNARKLIVKMRDADLLESELHGRVNVYRLAHTSIPRYQAIEGTLAQPAWGGTFHSVIYTVPESQRTLRDRLQHMTSSAGYGQLRAGVLISPDDRWSRIRIADSEFADGAWLLRAVITPANEADARAMSLTAWKLDEVAALYDRALAACATVPQKVQADWSALVFWRELYDMFYPAQYRDPFLPDALLPHGWPKDRFVAEQAAVNDRIGNVLQPFLREHANALDQAGNGEYYRSPWARA
jgi:DNA-binding transcriptional regulator PaaX